MPHIPIAEAHDFEVLNADLTEIEPVERGVDTLLMAETDEGTYLLVVESQGKRERRTPLLPVPGWLLDRGGRLEAYCRRPMLMKRRVWVDQAM